MTSLKNDIGDDADFLIQMLTVCLSSFESFRDNLLIANNNKDAFAIMQYCHKIAPTCLMLGLPEFYARVREIESNATSEGYEAVAKPLAQVMITLETIPGKIKKKISELS